MILHDLVSYFHVIYEGLSRNLRNEGGYMRAKSTCAYSLCDLL